MMYHNHIFDASIPIGATAFALLFLFGVLTTQHGHEKASEVITEEPSVMDLHVDSLNKIIYLKLGSSGTYLHSSIVPLGVDSFHVYIEVNCDLDSQKKNTKLERI